MLHLGMSGCTPIHSLLHILGFPLLSSSMKFSNIFKFIYQGSTFLVVPSSPLLSSCAKLMVVSPLSTSFEGSSICVELYLGRHPTSVCVFPDPILFLASLKPSWECGQQRHAIMAGGKANEEPVTQPVEVIAYYGESPKPEWFVVYPGSVAARIKDRKCKTRGGSSRPPVKRKLAPGSPRWLLELSAIVSDVPVVFVKIAELRHVLRSSASQHTRRLLESSGYLFCGEDLFELLDRLESNP
uniref:Uncharacterized protein n=1 Tax=Tanacetum cinerariifolium TaxID=118510 RepID=A0A699JH34_TANCI|nr:hypothetical protein [Tanacetum cinerariifolium]